MVLRRTVEGRVKHVFAVAVIPARGGSKRVVSKNLRLVQGKPLVARAIEVADRAGFFEAVLVSTDCDEIGKVAVDCGAQVVWRPADISRDDSPTEAALLHVLDDLLSGAQVQPEWVFTLAPTSPLRTAATLERVARAAREQGDVFDSFVTVHETRDDLWSLSERGELRRLFPDAPRRQQDRQPLWVENGVAYCTRADSLRERRSVLGFVPCGIVTDRVEGLDVNSEDDLLVASLFVER